MVQTRRVVANGPRRLAVRRGDLSTTEYFLQLNDSGPQYLQTDTINPTPTIKRYSITFRPHDVITTTSGVLDNLMSASSNRFMATASNTTGSVPNERLTFWGLNAALTNNYAAINDRDITTDWHTVDVTYNETERKYSDIIYDDETITPALGGNSDGVMFSIINRLTFNAFGNGGSSFVGMDLRNFQVWDDNDALIWDFPLNEGVGNPINRVTGAEGNLVNGTWVEITT
jgi:hypothetical protein